MSFDLDKINHPKIKLTDDLIKYLPIQEVKHIEEYCSIYDIYNE